MSFKKGSVLDIPLAMGIILGAAITFLILNTIVRTIDGTGAFGATWTTFVDNSFGLMDSLFVFGFLSLFLAIIIMAAMTKSTPIMFAVGILLLILSVFISPIIANVYNAIATNTAISTGHSTLDTFFSKFPLIILIVGGIIAVVNMLGGSGSE